jgi:hypothetical protein
MPLSAHERTQFERLTANLELGDSAALRKMRKKDRATAMSYFALPSRNTVLLMMIVLDVFVFVGSVLTRNVMLTNVSGVFGILLTAAVVLNSMGGITTVTGNPKAKN